MGGRERQLKRWVGNSRNGLMRAVGLEEKRHTEEICRRKQKHKVRAAGCGREGGGASKFAS